MSESFTEQLRRSIRESGMSRYAIWKATGIAQSTLSGFMSGRRGLSLDSLDRLFDLLRLTITTQEKKRGARRVASKRPS
jgi:predicted transcriptional regulator